MTDQRGSATTSVEALQSELERLRVLYAVSRDFSTSLDFDQLLPKVFDSVLTALGAQGGSLWIAEGDELRCRLALGSASHKLVGTTVPVGTGFVGDVARKQRSTLVRNAIEDPRFQMNLDRGSGMITTTLLAAPMVAEGVTVGAIEVANKLTGDGLFDEGDRQLLEGLAASAALALRNAQLHGAEKRARDLALLLEISREITATLDLDRVLQSVVNLAARAIPFERGAVGLYKEGRCEIRAIAGEEQVDPRGDAPRRLAARGAWALERGEIFYLADRAAAESVVDRAFVTAFGEDLEADGVASGLYLPLKDEEGTLGVLLFESSAADFAGATHRELAAILANQTAVALRNAELYHQVPLADAFGALAQRRRVWMRLPRRRLKVYVASVVVAVAALTLVRWPLRVAGDQPAFRPVRYADVRALVPGVIERVLVREGDHVPAGAPLVQLRDAELRAERESRAAELAVAERAAALDASRGDAGTERLDRTRAEALRQEVAVLDAQIAALTIRAPMGGVVLTPRPEQRIGVRLGIGEPVVTVGTTDTLLLEFGVAQQDIGLVQPGQAVRLRVDALPERTFMGTVASVGVLPVPDSASSAVHFPVRATVPNAGAVLKAGMSAHARVLTRPYSVAGRVFRAPTRWLRLLWWRMRP